MVQNLVHPSLYPLVYGRSKALRPESVGVKDAIDKWAGKGDVIQKNSSNPDPASRGVPDEYWSDTYQWLPANVAFQEDGSVKFTSYINNLHPTKYPEIYCSIEKLIDASLSAWDQCLLIQDPSENVASGAGRMESRFSTTMPENVE